MAALSVLETVGQIAGIGGIALGVLTVIFRDVIRKNIFPNLGQIHAFRLIRMMVVLTFCISALGLGAWVYVNSGPDMGGGQVIFPKLNPEKVTAAHLKLIDENRYAEAYGELANVGRDRFHQDLFVKTFENQRKPLGKVKSRRLIGANSYTQWQGLPNGAYTTSTFVTDFENGKYVESVTTIGEAGIWKPLFHVLGPCSPQFCT